MNADSVVTLGMVILAGMGLVLLAWAVPQWLVRRWRAKAMTLHNQIAADLRTLGLTQKQLRREAQFYPSNVPAPYDLPAQKLQTTLMALAAIHDHLRTAVDATSSKALAAPATPWQRISQHLWQRPNTWRRRLSQLEASQSQVQDLRVLTARANFVLRELRGKPLETARQARLVHQQTVQAETSLATLRAAGVHGEALEATATDLQTLESALSRLPSYLFADADSRVMRQARPADVADAWQQLQALAPKIEQRAAAIAAWHTGYEDLSRELATMQQTLESATKHLSKLHPSIDGQAMGVAWQVTQRRAEELMLRYVSPALEDLAERVEISEVNDEAQRLLGRLATIEALRLSLEGCLAKNETQLEQIDVQLRQLTEIGRYPLDRVPYQATLDHLGINADRVRQDRPTPERPCMPEDLETCLASAQVVQQQTKSFLVQLAEAHEDRRRLKDLMERAGINSGEAPSMEHAVIDWQAWAGDLHQRTHTYAPENWQGPSDRDVSPPMNVTAILPDAQALIERAERWMPQHIDEPLSPDTLHQRVAEIEQLLTDIDAFQDRLDRITLRLQKIQELEERTRTQVTQIVRALEQLDEVATDTLPPGLAAEANHWQQVQTQLKAGRALIEALDRRAEGCVDDKAEDANVWARDCQRTLRAWQRVLQRELNDAQATLTTRLDDLQSIAPLDGEAAVRDAQALVRSLPQQAFGRRRHKQGSPPGNADDGARVVLVSGDRSDAGSAAVGLADEVAEQLLALATLDEATACLERVVLSPLTESVTQWQTAQETAERAFADLKRLEAASARTWPPLSCDVGAVENQVHRVEQALSELHQDGHTVEHVQRALQTIVQLYEAVTSMAEARYEAYDEARSRLDAALDRLEQWSADLEDYGKEHAKTPAIAAAVSARLEEIDSAWSRLQGQYDHRSELMSTEEAERLLERLWLQTHRDLALGTGYDRIPTIAIERR